ncbi:MAG: hypothetical protein ABRQ23_09730 [Syntrophomonadaceae bacterium]
MAELVDKDEQQAIEEEIEKIEAMAELDEMVEKIKEEEMLEKKKKVKQY